MINPYQFRIGEILTVVYADTKAEAEQKFAESMESYNKDIAKDFVEQIILNHFPVPCSDGREVFISKNTLRDAANRYKKDEV